MRTYKYLHKCVTEINFLYLYLDPVGLEDSDVLNEEEKIRKTDLQTLFKSEVCSIVWLTAWFITSNLLFYKAC